MMKKLAVLTTALCLAFTLLIGCVGAEAAAFLSEGTALGKARKYVPATVRLTDSEWDREEAEWEFEFRTKTGKTEYEVTIDGRTGRIREAEMEKKGVFRAKKYLISAKAAEEIVRKTFKTAKILRVRRKTDDGCRVYTVTFSAGAYRGTAVVNGATGIILEWEKRY